MQSLEKAKAKWRRPRPWRSAEEGEMIRRYLEKKFADFLDNAKDVLRYSKWR
jgi:hypothetical protein